jgi:hypothetical protein
MTSSEYSWYREVMENNYRIPYLTDDQVDKILQYEKEKAHFPSDQFFSLWEEAEYERYVFKPFLTDEQWKVYNTRVDQNIQFNEKSFIDRDGDLLPEIKRQEERLRFYEDLFVPGISSDPKILINIISLKEQSKINYLKDEYYRYLNSNKAKILVDHFRYYRGLQPNQLKLSLILHKISCVWPDYTSFENHMDKPTKSIAGFIKEMIKINPGQFFPLLDKQYKLLHKYSSHLSGTSIDDIPGWHTVQEAPSPIKENEAMIMNFLIYDKVKYIIT